LQLQHVNIAAALPFSDHSLRRWPPPHHIQLGCGFAVSPHMAEFGFKLFDHVKILIFPPST
jgi:hypothetical protein